MLSLISQSGRPIYGMQEYYLDTPSDLTDLIKINSDAPGSEATVISTGEKYRQNSQGQWILQPIKTSGGSSGSGKPGVSIVGVTVDDNNNLTCTMSDGTTIEAGQIKTVRGPAGSNGISIKLVAIDENNHLIITLSDNSRIDAGLLPTGPAGSAGKDGKDGKSAYQLALDNGFEGTEQEWLESLKGGAEIKSITIDELEEILI